MADTSGAFTAYCTYDTKRTEVVLGSHAWTLPLADLAVAVVTQALRQFQVPRASNIPGTIDVATRTAVLNTIEVFSSAHGAGEALPFDPTRTILDAGVPTNSRPAVIVKLVAAGVQALLNILPAETTGLDALTSMSPAGLSEGTKATTIGTVAQSGLVTKDPAGVDADTLGLTQRKKQMTSVPTRTYSDRGVQFNDALPWTAILERDIRGLSCHIREMLASLKRYFRAVVFTLLNVPVFITALIAMLSVYISSDHLLGIRYRVDSILISFGVMTPLTFSIQAAFTRRESASRNVANLKANCLALYLIHRDWNRPEPGDLSTVGENHVEQAAEIRSLIRAFLQGVRGFLLRRNRAQESQAELYWEHTTNTNSWVSIIFNNRVRFHRNQMVSTFEDPALVSAYRALSKLSIANERILQKWGWTKAGEGPSARLSFALNGIITEFEQVQLVRNYRTPVMLRYGNRVLIHIMSVFLGPYFNSFCMHDDGSFQESSDCRVNYIMAFIFIVIVNLLYNIAKDIEYPFDYEGMDDLFFDVDAEFDEFAHLQTGGVNDLFKTPALVAPPTDKNV